MRIQNIGDILNEAKKTSIKRGDPTNLVVTIGDKRFFNTEASNTFVEVIEFVSNEVGIEKFIKDYMENDISGRKFIGFKESDFPEYVRHVKTNSTGQFLINTHMSTSEKKNILDRLLEFYDIKGSVDVRNKVEKSYTNMYYLLGAYDGDLGKGQKSELWKTYVAGGYWLNGFYDGTDTFKLKDEVSQIPVGANVAIKSSYVTGKVNPTIMIKARGVVTKNYGDGTKIDVDWEKGFKPFEIIRSDVGGYRQTLHDISNKKEHIDLIFNSESNVVDSEKDRVIPPTEFIKTPEKPKVYVKNPFGCKQKDGSETSALCVIGKSGSGKTTSTEIALESMEHEYLLYIPIEGEYTFSQYTGEGFEMSSLGEFMMMAQNNPSKCYTVIFDECHRPITISKLNTDLLQALSSKRNRGGDRFVTIDRSTKRMYTTPTEEFPIPLKEKSGKVLVPDNFGIVCLSSNPAVICRNDDFLNRVDLVVFHQSDREVQDLTKLKKLEPIEKNIESIRGLLLSDGKQEL